MHRIDTTTATVENKFTSGNPSTATPATVVSADWLNAVQEEIVNVITGAGITPSKPTNTQLFEAIKALATPTGAVMEYAGSAAPTGWLLCFGQAVSRTTYAALFSAIGTTFGAGDGSTTFNLPDHRDRVAAGKGDMGGTAAGRLTLARTGNTTNASNQLTNLSSITNIAVGMQVVGAGIPAGVTITDITGTTATLSANATATATGVSLRIGPVDSSTLGSVGGDVAVALTAKQMPAHNHSVYNQSNGEITNTGSTTYTTTQGNSNTTSTSVSLNTGGDQAHTNVQPTIIMNFIIKT